MAKHTIKELRDAVDALTPLMRDYERALPKTPVCSLDQLRTRNRLQALQIALDLINEKLQAPIGG